MGSVWCDGVLMGARLYLARARGYFSSNPMREGYKLGRAASVARVRRSVGPIRAAMRATRGSRKGAAANSTSKGAAASSQTRAAPLAPAKKSVGGSRKRGAGDGSDGARAAKQAKARPAPRKNTSSPSELEEEEEPPEEYCDPTTAELMEDPVILPSGQSMDRANIMLHLNGGYRNDPFSLAYWCVHIHPYSHASFFMCRPHCMRILLTYAAFAFSARRRC